MNTFWRSRTLRKSQSNDVDLSETLWHDIGVHDHQIDLTTALGEEVPNVKHAPKASYLACSPQTTGKVCGSDLETSRETRSGLRGRKSHVQSTCNTVSG